MAVYTPLPKSALEQAASAFGLGALRSAEGVPQGSINTNYRLQTDRGRFFLRHTTARGEPELRFEAALLAHLAEAQFPAPRPLPTRDGAPFIALEGGRVSVFDYLAGEELTRDRLTVPLLTRLGEEVGKLHRLTASFSAARSNPYDFACVQGWLEGLRGHADAEVARALPELTAALALAAQKDHGMLPRGAIHADLFLDNVKWLGDRVSAFFDFEMACLDAYALDLAITLNAWCFDGGYRPELCRALLEGYQRERPLTEAERQGLFLQALFGAVRYTLSRIRDFHLSPLPPERLMRKDFRTYLARVTALRGLGEAGFRSLLAL